MILVFKSHPTNNECYIAPLSSDENYEYAVAMLRHFGEYCGIFSKKDLDLFIKISHLHGHEIKVI